jgi:hypothetical protein
LFVFRLLLLPVPGCGGVYRAKDLNFHVGTLRSLELHEYRKKAFRGVLSTST